MRKITAFLCLLLLSSFSLLAQDKGVKKDTIQQALDDVLISFKRWEKNLNEVPNLIRKINIKDSRIVNPQTTADLLGIGGDVFIQKSQGGGGSPMIRGFATNRLMIVIDGVRMNNAIFRSGNLQNVISLDPLATEDAEVIFGPGSLIYGSDAIGGVMDFHSLSPKFANATKTYTKANVVTRYATANQEQTFHADFNIASKKLSWLGSFTHSDFGDLKMGKNGGQDSYLVPKYVQRIGNKDSVFINPNPRVQKFSGYHQTNVLNKLRYRPNSKWDFLYAHHYSSTGNIPRFDRLIEYTGNNPSFAQWYYGPQVWQMHSFQVTHVAKNNWFDAVRFIAAYQDYEESRHDRRLNNARLRNQTESVKALSFNLDFNKTINENTEIFYGAEIIHNKVGSFADRINITNGFYEKVATRYPNNSTWTSYGTYISYKKKIAPKFTFSTGGRYNYVNIHAPFDTSLFKLPFTQADVKTGAFTTNAGLVYRPNSHWQWNINASTGFRVPNIDDIGKVFESAPGIVVVPNNQLKAEYAYNVDLGFAAVISPTLKVDATTFFTWLDNALTRRPFTYNGADSIVFDGVWSAVEAIQNIAVANVWGVQAGIEFSPNQNFSWTVRANYIKGNETDDKKNEKVPLRHAPPFYASSNIKYTKGKITIIGNMQYNSSISNNNLAPTEKAKTAIYAKDMNGLPYSPAWFIMNIKTAYQINTKCQLNFGWENITNQRYRPYSSGIVAAGSNVVVSARITI
jgi:hemoglobin/transferrin/lactoferrin receptor protein